jgi:hypothetical protein
VYKNMTISSRKDARANQVILLLITPAVAD